MVDNLATATPLENILAQGQLNRLDQFTPTGSVTFSGPGRSTLNLDLPPGVQDLLDRRIGVSGAALDVASSGLGETFSGTFDESRARAEEAAFNRSLGLVSPELQRIEDATRTRLINRGLDEQAPGFLNQLNQQVTEPRNRLLETLARGSVAEGRNEISSRINQLAGVLGLQQEKPPTIRDFIAPAPIDVLGPESLAFNQNLAGQNSVLAQDQIKAAEDAARLGNLSRLGSAAITGVLSQGGLGGFMKGLGLGNGSILGEGGVLDVLTKGAVEAGSSIAEFLGGLLGPGVEGTQAAAEVLGTIPGIDTNLILQPASQVSQSITGIPGAVDVASIPGNATDVGQGLIGLPPDGAAGIPEFVGQFAIDPTTGAAIGSSSALSSAGMIGSSEAGTLLANGFTPAEIAAMNQSLGTASTAGTGAAAGGFELAGIGSSWLGVLGAGAGSAIADLAAGKKRDVAKNAAFTTAGAAIGSAFGPVGTAAGGAIGRFVGENMEKVFPAIGDKEITPAQHGMGNAAAAFAEVMGGDVNQHGMAGAPQGQVIAADWLMQRGGQAAVDSFNFHISQPNTDVGAALKRAAQDNGIPFESGTFGMSIADIAAEQAND